MPISSRGIVQALPIRAGWADLTAASLLWPMLPWNGDEAAMLDCLPHEVGQWRQGFTQRPLYGWLQRTYRLHRPEPCIQP